MQFLVLCEDAPGASELRRKHLKEHLDYIEGIVDRIQVAGPFRKEGSPEYQGSCFIYNAENAREALQLLFDDPYYRAGIYQEHRILEFRSAAGRWVGGKNW